MQCKVRLALSVQLVIALGLTTAEDIFELPDECKAPEGDALCRANLPAWIYNKTTGYCEHVANGKCYSRGKFSTEEDCNIKCRDPFLGVCAQPLERDQCRARFTRYAFSPRLRRCRQYTGCYYQISGGNSFATYKECNATCGKFSQDPCLLSPDKGTQCRKERSGPLASDEWFAFDERTERCLSLNYTGCGGNRNKFPDESDCWRVCWKHIKNPCNIPISQGHICPRTAEGAAYQAYGYNFKTKRCESFLYKGCGGNDNRFPTAKKCWNTCAISSDTKCLKKAALNYGGIGIFTRFYYDIDSNQCRLTKHFITSNKDRNRFYSLMECEQECKAAYTGKATWMDY